MNEQVCYNCGGAYVSHRSVVCADCLVELGNTRTPEYLGWQGVENIRYGGINSHGHGQLLFDWKGFAIQIREPDDVVLVGGGEAAQRWIYDRYWYVLR